MRGVSDTRVYTKPHASPACFFFSHSLSFTLWMTAALSGQERERENGETAYCWCRVELEGWSFFGFAFPAWRGVAWLRVRKVCVCLQACSLRYSSSEMFVRNRNNFFYPTMDAAEKRSKEQLDTSWKHEQFRQVRAFQSGKNILRTTHSYN